MAKRGVSRNPGYKPGSHWAVCDSCGFQFRAEDLRETWDHRWVCDDDWEPRHPQEFLKIREEKSSVNQPVRLDDTSNVGVSSSFRVVTNVIENFEQVGAETNLPASLTSPQLIDFSENGEHAYIADLVGTVYHYSLSTAFDPLSISGVADSFNPSESVLIGAVNVRNNGTKAYITDLATFTIYQYTLTTPYVISSAQYDSISFVAPDELSALTFMYLDYSGEHLYLCPELINKHIVHYMLSTPFNISTAQESDFVDRDSVIIAGGGLTSIKKFIPSTDGYHGIGYGANTGNVISYSLSTPWDLQTISTYDTRNLYTGGQGDTPGVGYPESGVVAILSDSTVSKYTGDQVLLNTTDNTVPQNFTPDSNDPSQVIPAGTNNNEL